MKHLVLIDGHHMMYRAYWAIPRTMRTKAGEQVNMPFGMASMILSILLKEQPDGVVIAFDEGDETFRHQENESYKDGRAETPDDFYVQIPRVMQVLQAMQFVVVSHPKYEADDFIASYACAAEKRGTTVTVVSGDKDLFQLVSDHIRIAIPHKGYQSAEYLGPQDVEAKLGIRPDQVPSFKGLSGDSSDNLPGVKGIGPKTAATLLQRYDSLEGIYEHLDEIRPAWKEKLERDKDQAFFCERMATLECDIPLPFPLEDTELAKMPVAQVYDVFTELEFTLLSKRLDSLLDLEYGMNHFNIDERDHAKKSMKNDHEDQMSLF